MTPALVVGADINGLGVVRSLAREDVPTWLVDSNPADPSMHTRHGRKLSLPALSGKPLIDGLLELRGMFDADPVICLTQEASVKAVSADLDRVAACYRLAMPAASVMEKLMDKARFQLLAERLGFPIPRAVHLRNRGDLGEVDGLRYPCVLKPVVKTPCYDGRFKKAYKIEGSQELRDIFARIDGAAEMIAQEWIEGGDDRIYFCLQYRTAEKALASFAGRKLRSWPPRTGGTASCVPAPECEDELRGLTDAFFEAAGCYGFASMEFKRDSRTGEFLMIEPTVGRTDFQEEIATLNGTNIPYAAYCSLIGREIPQPRRVLPPAAWVVSPIDRWSAEVEPSAGAREFPAGLRHYDAVRRVDDPLPWCYSILDNLKSRLVHRFFRKSDIRCH